MPEERKYDVTDRDLLADYDESKLDRVGKPMGIEHHDAGKPELSNQAKVKASHTLVDMAKDYEFFTTGIIHAVTNWERDPITEYNKIYPTADNSELPLIIDYAESFFEGLGVGLVAGRPVNLDRRLYAIIRPRWERLRDVVAGMAVVDRRTSFYARYNFYEIEMVDPFALKKMTVVDKLPKVTVTVFGVSSNKAFSWLESRQYPLLPKLMKREPEPDIKIEGRNVIGPPPAPEKLLPKNG